MIDEKKLIENILCDDGINFNMDFDVTTPESFGESLQEYTDRIKGGIVRLIEAQPRIGFTNVKEGYPTDERDYLCRCNIDGHDEFPFYMVLRYHLIDETPHFQHETAHGLHVTHWMAFEPPKDGGGR